MGAKEVIESPHPETLYVASDLHLIYRFYTKWTTFSEAISALPKVMPWNFRVARGVGEWEMDGSK